MNHRTQIIKSEERIEKLIYIKYSTKLLHQEYKVQESLSNFIRHSSKLKLKV